MFVLILFNLLQINSINDQFVFLFVFLEFILLNVRWTVDFLHEVNNWNSSIKQYILKPMSKILFYNLTLNNQATVVTK